MHLILVAPDLLARPRAALAAVRSLAVLAQRARQPHVYRAGLAAALLDALEVPSATAIAPLAALGAGIEVSDYMITADPVLFAADRDDVVLIQRVDDLTGAESAELIELLNRHFETDGLRFVAARPDAWFARCARIPSIATTPFDAAVLHGIFPFLPTGADAGTWQRWQNEISMLVHEHPVNDARQIADKAPVTGIWFSGGGTLADANPLPAASVRAPLSRIGDLARGIAKRGGGVAASLTPSDSLAQMLGGVGATSGDVHTVHVVVTDAIDHDDKTAQFDANWLTPALHALDRRQLERFTLIGDGHGAAVRWTAIPQTLWQRMTAGRRKPFAIPELPES
ncbi:MAG TPA: hypothetical protein VJX31_06605 [Casimicrobiaceae bacterium]|nr:hypothetical protein [Casimicrobiaceae bacterium]